jgi:acyl-CoA thioesterase YciA
LTAWKNAQQRKTTVVLGRIDLRVVLFSAQMSDTDQPKGELVIQTIAMPKDTNRDGDIFGGWLISQMDLGSAILAAKVAKARVVTVALEAMSFLQPVRVGDTVACYARVEKIGRTSMTIPVEVWVTRYMTGEQVRVTHGVFIYVAVDRTGKPIPVKREPA